MTTMTYKRQVFQFPGTNEEAHDLAEAIARSCTNGCAEGKNPQGSCAAHSMLADKHRIELLIAERKQAQGWLRSEGTVIPIMTRPKPDDDDLGGDAA
jgi:hypothetical protein